MQFFWAPGDSIPNDSIHHCIAGKDFSSACHLGIDMNISYVVLILLLLCFVALTVTRYSARFSGVRSRSQSGARKQRPQRDPNESLRCMIEDRYGSSWRVTSADNSEVH